MPRPQRTSSRKRKSVPSSSSPPSSTSRDKRQNKRQKQEMSLTTTDSNSGIVFSFVSYHTKQLTFRLEFINFIVLVRVENEVLHATTSLQAATKNSGL
jgi:penicillin-binding protein-related factor A (putative recombinase)